MTNEVSDPVKRRVVRKFTAEQRAQMVAQSYAPGVSVREVAQRLGVRPNLLSYWRGLQNSAGVQTTVPAKAVARSATLAAVCVKLPAVSACTVS
jgi:transposase-like protein